MVEYVCEFDLVFFKGVRKICFDDVLAQNIREMDYVKEVEDKSLSVPN